MSQGGQMSVHFGDCQRVGNVGLPSPPCKSSGGAIAKQNGFRPAMADATGSTPSDEIARRQPHPTYDSPLPDLYHPNLNDLTLA